MRNAVNSRISLGTIYTMINDRYQCIGSYETLAEAADKIRNSTCPANYRPGRKQYYFDKETNKVDYVLSFVNMA